MMHRHYNNSFECKTHGSFPETDKWAFKSKAWAECKFKHVNLTTIHRQRDRAFIDILERCRMGKKLTSEETNLLLNHKCKVQNPTRLYSTRAEVNRLNEAEYAKLRNKERPYKAFDDALIHPHHPNLHMKAERGPDGLIAALREGKFEPQVDLKQGMRVVLQVNLSIADGLVNGAQGVIGGWEPYSKEKLPRTEKKTGMTSRDRDPAAAMTVAPNTINGEHAQYREAKLKEFVKDRQIKEWPIVDFDNGLRRTIYAECLVYEFGDDAPYSIMSRTQLPLIAGWAMTVHKSQGMTLNQVEVDLGKAFEEGQMYVALSRATSLEGLKVKSLGTMTGGGNAEVHEFLRDKFGLKG
jgi:ATP-dependent DNA helicase PIF1